jgi:hypothetical protein
MKNYNVSPYFDDFDPNKNYHRVLFKPGQAVQARELTQLQTILQNQISEFASAIYSQNTPISGGKVTTNLKCSYIKLNYFYDNSSIVISDFLDATITDSTGTINARVIAVAAETGNQTSEESDFPTLIVTYLSGKQFSDGMDVYRKVGLSTIPFATTIGTAGGTTSVGTSSVASISQGVFYVVNGYNTVTNDDGTTSKFSIGTFVNVPNQTVILDKYDSTPSYRVGLNIVESTITSSDDLSLLDPASGSSNYQAPGADRYQINLELVNLPLTLGNDDGFIELLRIEKGSILKQTDSTVYSTIDDYFAKRDYESNGDYVVEDFKLTAASNAAGDKSKYDLTIGKGIAYVRGYRIENQSQIAITSDRAQTTDSINPNSVFMDYGNYFVVDNMYGDFDYVTMPLVDLHSVPAEQINTTSRKAYNSTLVGNCFIRNLDYQSSSGSNTKSYIFNAHVSDIDTNTLTGSVGSATPTTLTINDADGIFSSTNGAYAGIYLQIVSGTNIGDSKLVSSYNGVTKTFTISSPFNITPDTSSRFSIIFSTKNVNSLVRVSNSLVKTAYANINVNSGKENGYNSYTIFQAAGAPQLIFRNGYQYSADVSNSNYYSTQVFRNVGFSGVSNSLTITTMAPISIDAPIGSPIYGESFKQLFTLINTATGQILDFSSSNNSVILNSNTSATFTSSQYANIQFGIDVYATVFVSNGNNTNLILKQKNLVLGNTSYFGTLTAVTSNTAVDLASGQVLINNSAIGSSEISLYLCDVKNIKKIIDVGTDTNGALSSYKDITNSFHFDNGQRDTHYDHATIKLLAGVNRPKGNILVIFDYYSHTGGDGYFSVNSYLTSGSPENYAEIPSYTAKDGTLYQLKDCVDFRPARKKLQAGLVWEYKTNRNSFNVDIHGALIPRNLTNFQSNYSYYLGRKDKLVLSKDSKFLIIKGTPAINPKAPDEPDGSLVLANLALDPYTAYVQGERPSSNKSVPTNLSINKIVHKRWAKSDITTLQKQVNNLEYYTSLSMLEQKAQSLQVPDANGLNRFKNGILVDDFSSFGTADTAASGFAVNINVRKKQMTALTDVDNFQLQNPATLASFAIADNINTYKVFNLAGGRTNIFTLPCTTGRLIKQVLASSAVSVNPFNVFTAEGVATLNPPFDNWVNTVQPPAITITNPNMQFTQQQNGINVLNSGDFQTIPGTTTTYSEPQASQETAYASQSQGLQNAEASSSNAEGLASADGYVNNTAVSPYIKRQEVIVRCKGMSVNTPIDCWFDGVNVNEHMVTPNTIEVINVSGNFRQDDIIGFYEPNVGKFFPVARVVSVYRYPDRTSTRLYISDLVNPPETVTTTTLINATFDVQGNYISSTASGTVVFNNGSLISLSTSGLVTGPGGGFTSIDEPIPKNIFKSQVVNGFSSFANQYAVWGDPNNSSGYSATHSVSFDKIGTYKITAFSTGSGTITLNGSNIITLSSYGQTVDINHVNTSVENKTLSWSITNTGQIAGFGLVIYDPSGNIVWNTATPRGLNFGSVGTEFVMPDGGSYYIGTKKIQLDQNASSVNGYYVGAEITVNSAYVYEYNYGAVYIPPYPPLGADGDARNESWWQALAAQWQTAYNASEQAKNSVIRFLATGSYTARITSYDGATRTATLAKDENVTIGKSEKYGNLQSTYSIRGTVGSIADAIHDGNSTPSLATDEHGQFVSIFNIPGSTFHTGQRVFRVDNRNIPTDASTATTYAQAIFTAGGLQSTNITSFSPSIDSSSTNMTAINQQSYNILNNSSSTDPVAQTFIVSKDNYPNGVFLSSVKLFFAPLPGNALPSVPVTISIVNTLNGVPNGKVLDYSKVILDADQINTSATPHYLDPKTYTEFVFDAPVYIQSGVLYAFLVQSSTSDYYLYYAQQNSAAIPSTGKSQPSDANPATPTKIGAAPYVGALFESQNSITWTADQTKNLMFVINQYIFDTNSNPVLPFVVPKNLPYKKLGSKDILSSVDSSLINQIVPTTSPTSPVHAINVTTTDFSPTDTNISYTYSTTLTSDLSETPAVTVTPGKYGTPTQDNIYLNDGLGERILLRESNNSFELLASMTSSDKYVSPVISDDGISLFRLTYHINNMGIEGGNIITVNREGANYNANATLISISDPDIGSDKAVLSFTSNTYNNSIESIYVTYPGSGYLKTPTITVTDISGSGSGASATVYGETSPTGGNAFAKYYTKKVILTPTNESGDLRVYYSAYKPLNTEVYVYYRILNPNDSELLENQNWQLMTPITNTSAYSKDRSDIIEFECAPGTFGMGPDQAISYISTNGQKYTSFTQFALKFVLATSDKTTVPFLTDLRALALPSGTGI